MSSPQGLQLERWKEVVHGKTKSCWISGFSDGGFFPLRFISVTTSLMALSLHLSACLSVDIT